MVLEGEEINNLIEQLEHLHINPIMAQQLQEILNRLQALEQANVPTQSTTDYSDPVLIFENANPAAIEKIPDLVKEIPIFNGNSDELSGWIRDVDAIVQSYRVTEDSTVDQKNKFYAICVSIRRKIKGEANTALVNSNVNINWNLIKKTLKTYYGEKRDLTTLDYQLMNCAQKGRSLEIFFDDINKLLALIASQIQSSEEFAHPEAGKAMISVYNKKAIDAFVRGLDGDVGKFLKNHEPDSLASAYSYCITYQNMEYRQFMSNPKNIEPTATSRNFLSSKLPPRIPFRPPPHTPRQINNPVMQRHNFSNIPQPPNYNQNFGHSSRARFEPVPKNPFIQQQQNQQQQQRPPTIQQRQQRLPRPEPMEVDPSIRSRQVNYTNRPKQYHVTTSDQIDIDQYLEQVPYLAEECCEEGTSFERYSYNLENQEPDFDLEQLEENAELNFLG